MSSPAQDRDIKSLLHSAFSFVKSVEANKASAPLTLDHMLKRQITLLKAGEVRSIVSSAGKSMGDRISRYDQLKQLKAQVDAIVQSAAAMAPKDVA